MNGKPPKKNNNNNNNSSQEHASDLNRLRLFMACRLYFLYINVNGGPAFSNTASSVLG